MRNELAEQPPVWIKYERAHVCESTTARATHTQTRARAMAIIMTRKIRKILCITDVCCNWIDSICIRSVSVKPINNLSLPVLLSFSFFPSVCGWICDSVHTLCFVNLIALWSVCSHFMQTRLWYIHLIQFDWLCGDSMWITRTSWPPWHQRAIALARPFTEPNRAASLETPHQESRMIKLCVCASMCAVNTQKKLIICYRQPHTSWIICSIVASGLTVHSVCALNIDCMSRARRAQRRCEVQHFCHRVHACHRLYPSVFLSIAN